MEQSAITPQQKAKQMAPRPLIDEVEKRIKQVIKLALEKTDSIDMKKEKFTKDGSYPYKVRVTCSCHFTF